MDILSTSAINNAVETYKYYEQTRRIDPLQIQKDKYSSLSSLWGGVQTKLDSLFSTLSDLKTTSSSGIFNNKSATLSNSDFFSVTPTNTAITSAYTLNVGQLAKGDLAVSDTLASDGASGISSGTHTIQIQSGDYTGTADVELDGTETYEELMTSITNSLNSDKAVITSADPTTGPFTQAGTLSFDVNGTSYNVDYDYTSQTYTQIVDDLVSQINDTSSGLTAENVDGNLQITVDDSDDYITISDSSGTLATDFGITATNEKGVSGLVDVSVFSPSTDNGKLSITAKESGYDNRLIMSDSVGSALSTIGFTGSILTNHTDAPDDNTAGFKYDVTSSTSNDLNAKFTFNGINIQRNSNTVDDLVNGVTIDLKAEMEVTDPDVSISVTSDVSGITSKIQEFIDNFNSAYNTIRGNYYSGDGGRGVFVGDQNAIALMRELQNVAIDEVSGIADGNYNRLSDIGIDFDPDVGLSITSSADLESAITERVDEVADLFNSTSGIASSLYDTLDTYLGFDGALSQLTDSYDTRVSYYADRITSTNERIDKGSDILRTKYQALQMQYAEMLSMSSLLNTGGFF